MRAYRPQLPRRTLRVGFLIAGPSLASWQASVIRDTHNELGFEVFLIRQEASELACSGGAVRRWLFEWERRIFQRSLRHTPNIAALAQPVAVEALGVDVAFSNEREAASLDLDVLVSFVEPHRLGAMRGMARHGVWALVRLEAATGSGTSIGFWECREKRGQTGVALVDLNGIAGGTEFIAQGWYQTDLSSWTLNRLVALEQGRQLLTDALLELAERDRAPRVQIASSDFRDVIGHGVPTTWQVAVALCRLFGRRIRASTVELLSREQWFLRIAADTERAPLSRKSFVAHAPSQRYWWCDPFAVSRGGRKVIFAEEYDGVAGKAHITAFEMRDRKLVRRGVILNREQHLSYPFVFEHRGELYMIPESSANQTVELWRCVDFPDHWEKRRDIFTGVRAADTTLLQHGGKWWLFTNIARSAQMPNHCIELFIFSADDPVEGEWRPHPYNPVVVDARRARMGGGFWHDAKGAIYRLAQHNSYIYGEHLAACKVEVLSETEYRETPVQTAEFDWLESLYPLHHVARSDGIVVVDSRRRVLRLPLLARPLSRAQPSGMRRSAPTLEV